MYPYCVETHVALPTWLEAFRGPIRVYPHHCKGLEDPSPGQALEFRDREPRVPLTSRGSRGFQAPSVPRESPPTIVRGDVLRREFRTHPRCAAFVREFAKISMTAETNDTSSTQTGAPNMSELLTLPWRGGQKGSPHTGFENFRRSQRGDEAPYRWGMHSLVMP